MLPSDSSVPESCWRCVPLADDVRGVTRAQVDLRSAFDGHWQVRLVNGSAVKNCTLKAMLEDIQLVCNFITLLYFTVLDDDECSYQIEVRKLVMNAGTIKLRFVRIDIG